MKTVNTETLGLQELTTNDLNQIAGGSWLSDVAGFVGYCAGVTAHAIVDAALLVTGNFPDHKHTAE